MYAYIESESNPEPASPPSSPGRRGLLSSSISSSPDARILNLCMRAESLAHAHSRLRTAMTKSRPSTYYEISRKSTTEQWIVLYRSPPVRESLTPVWDEASIDLGSTSDLHNNPPLMITVYTLTSQRCKEIGSFDTTAQELIESCTTREKTSGYSRRFLHGRGAGVGRESDRRTFHLQRRSGIKESITSGESVGIITVVHASVEDSNDVRIRSQKFHSDDIDDDIDSGDVPPHSPSSPHHALPKFVDYVRAGMVNVDFCIAVDFTSSNGDPRKPSSLHYSK